MLDCSNFTFVHGRGELLVHAQLRGDSNLEYCRGPAGEAGPDLPNCMYRSHQPWLTALSAASQGIREWFARTKDPQGPLSEVGGGGC